MTGLTINLTEKKYIQFKLNSDIRHELINERLIDMPADSTIHNYICQNFLILFRQFLRNTKYSLFMEGVKLKIPEEKNTFIRISLSPKKSLILLPGIFYIMRN